MVPKPPGTGVRVFAKPLIFLAKLGPFCGTGHAVWNRAPKPPSALVPRSALRSRCVRGEEAPQRCTPLYPRTFFGNLTFGEICADPGSHAICRTLCRQPLCRTLPLQPPVQFLQLSFVPAVCRPLNGQDSVSEIAVALAAVTIPNRGGLCGDQSPFLQFCHILSHRVDAHAHVVPDSPQAGGTLVGAAFQDAGVSGPADG